MPKRFCQLNHSLLMTKVQSKLHHKPSKIWMIWKSNPDTNCFALTDPVKFWWLCFGEPTKFWLDMYTSRILLNLWCKIIRVQSLWPPLGAWLLADCQCKISNNFLLNGPSTGPKRIFRSPVGSWSNSQLFMRQQFQLMFCPLDGASVECVAVHLRPDFHWDPELLFLTQTCGQLNHIDYIL